MQLVEQHIIKRADPRFAPIDTAAFAAKNLYNAANYLVRQAFIFEHRYLGYDGRLPSHQADRCVHCPAAQSFQ